MRLIITAILIYILYKLLVSEKKDKARESKIKEDRNQFVGEMVQDPECKVYIPIDQAYERIIDGKKFYFCSKECADSYENKIKGERS